MDSTLVANVQLKTLTGHFNSVKMPALLKRLNILIVFKRGNFYVRGFISLYVFAHLNASDLPKVFGLMSFCFVYPDPWILELANGSEPQGPMDCCFF